MIRIAKHVLYDILRNRFVLFYTLFLFVTTLTLFSLDSDPGKGTLSLLNIILMVVPALGRSSGPPVAAFDGLRRLHRCAA